MDWQILIAEGGAVNLVGRSDAFEVEVIANIHWHDDVMTLSGLHFTKNSGGLLSRDRVMEFARDFLNQHGDGAEVLHIHGAERTTGRGAGRIPSTFTVRRT